MSLHDCLQRAIDSGDLPPRQARKAQELYAERLAAHAHLGQGAEAMAAEDVWVALRHQNIKNRRAAVMQIKANMATVEDLARHRDSDGQPNAASALRQMIEWGQSAIHQSVESTRQALEMSYLRDVQDLIQRHKVNITGSVSNKAKLADLVRELKGEATGDSAAREIAQAVQKTMERARQEFNAAGGEIGKLEGYDLPHHWDRDAVAKLGPDAFAAKMYDRMDWARIIDNATGQPFARSSKAARMQFLRDVQDNIRTGGWNRREPSGARMGASLGKSRAHHRVLHFKTADDWLEVNGELGTADPYSAIIHHLSSMARDTALMRRFGPNPAAGLEYAKQAAIKLSIERPWQPTKHLGAFGYGKSLFSSAEAEAKGVAKQADRMMDIYTGAANQPEMDMLASALSGVRHYLVASQLGGALLSAVSDVGFMGMAARHVGMSTPKVMARALKTLALPENRRLLARAGIIGESMAHTGVVQARLMGEAYGPKSMQRLSEFTLRASGLTAWTDIMRGVWQLEFYGLLADNAGRGWDDIDAPLRDLVFKARGITRADWDIIRTTDLHRDAANPDAEFLIPDDIRRRTDLDPDQALDLSLKLGSAVREQLEFAIPAASIRGRSSLQMGAPGTLGGEFARSVLMYKNFTLSLMFNQLGRVLHHKVNGSRGWNALLFGLTTTVAGILAIQLKELAAGRDPRPFDGRLIKAGVIQGGGLGIFGDYLYSTENRFGGGFAATAAGPMLGVIDRTGGLSHAFAKGLTEPDPEKRATALDAAQREAIRFANQFSGPTNLWYLNTAFDRLIWDNLTEWADPEAAEAFAAAAKRRQKEYGTAAYWPQGAAAPTRLPAIFAPSATPGAAP